METLFLSAVTVAALRAGVALLPRGRRRATLRARLEEQVLPLFTGRILAFDLNCTQAYADILGKAKQIGKAIAMADALIASIAAAAHFSVATRDTDPFQMAGVAVIDPWQTG